jgi:hypothetical protein
MEMLKEYKGDVTANLGKAERYFLTVSSLNQKNSNQIPLTLF